jgi:DNA-binding transcriptional LysR family regulator
MLLSDARETLAAHARLWARAEDARRSMRGHVSVGFVWSTLGAFLAPLVAATTERHPDIELSVSQLAFIELIPALRRGDIDLAIARRTWASAEMLEQTLRLEPSVLAVAEGHPFAGRATVTLADLDGVPMVALNRTLAPIAYDRVIEAARDRGVELRIVQHVRSAAEALALVAAGIGIYRMPASAAVPHPGVVYRELQDAASRVTLLRRPAPPSASVAAVTALAIELFGDAQSASKNARLDLADVPPAP